MTNEPKNSVVQFVELEAETEEEEIELCVDLSMNRHEDIEIKQKRLGVYTARRIKREKQDD